MLKNHIPIFIVLIFFGSIIGCKTDPLLNEIIDSKPTPYNLEIPKGFSQFAIPADTPITEQGVELGRHLFYDPILSGNNTQSCASCHKQKFAFTDSTNRYSVGITGAVGTRNAMPIFNLGWSKLFFWDGRAPSLETQALEPVTNPIEMHESWANAIKELQANPKYIAMYKAAFGSEQISPQLTGRAISQFMRTLLSGNSRYDKWFRKELNFTAQEIRGFNIYNQFDNDKPGHCVHCHTNGSTFTDFEFRNNGLDSVSSDLGLMGVSGQPNDRGKFKTPSLRNLLFTSPYMHDGRFKTLMEVIDFYDNGFHYPVNIDANMSKMPRAKMTLQDKQDLIAFLRTLSDSTLLTDTRFSSPF